MRPVIRLVEAVMEPQPTPAWPADDECYRCGRGPHPDIYHRYETWAELDARGEAPSE